MFGHVQANLNDLAEEEKERYHAVYCGLCRTLGERHGTLSRLGLSYDLTFLALLLSSLYEPDESGGESLCGVHPSKKHRYVQNRYIEYAADMTVALTYYKCLDDWQDDHSLPKKWYAWQLAGEYKSVRQQWQDQCKAMEDCLSELSRIENERTEAPDAAANCFGHLMSAVFLYKKDHWEEQLCNLGYSLGKFIYLADAAVDLKQDIKCGSYNPFKMLMQTPDEMRSTLKLVLGKASEAFEILPIVQDANLLRNILYSGLWIKFNREIKEERRRTK